MKRHPDGIPAKHVRGAAPGKSRGGEADPTDQESNACGWPGRGTRESPDLCCCFIIDPNDQYADPCEVPVDESCCL